MIAAAEAGYASLAVFPVCHWFRVGFHMALRSLLIGLSFLTVPMLLFADDEQNNGNGDLFVPSNRYPPIQSAINAARDP